MAAAFVTRKEKWKLPSLSVCAAIVMALAACIAGTQAGQVFGANMTDSHDY
jgi:hypothetical protein